MAAWRGTLVILLYRGENESSSSIKSSWTHSWSTLCYILFLVQFNGKPLAQAIFISHQSPCVAYGEATVPRKVVQYFGTAFL